LLLLPGAAITVAVDDTLFRRRGRKVHAAGWFHDGSAAGQVKLGLGNTWVVVAIVVTLPWLSRPVALPVLAALAVKGGPSKPDLARELVDLLAEHFPSREIHIVADAAYGCGAFCGLGDGMSMTTRPKANAVFHHPAPPRTGKRGRPRLKASGSAHPPTSPPPTSGPRPRCAATASPAVSSGQCITPRMILSGHDRRGVACEAMP
jgi:hypothetical protein